MGEGEHTGMWDRKVRAAVEGHFSVVRELCARYVRSQEEGVRTTAAREIASALEAATDLLHGKKAVDMTPASAASLERGYMTCLFQVESTLNGAALENEDLLPIVRVILHHRLQQLPKRRDALGAEARRFGQEVWSIEERQGHAPAPAWDLFLLNQYLQAAVFPPDLNMDDVYADVVGEDADATLSRRHALPLIAYAELTVAAREASQAMPDSERVAGCMYRVHDALNELIEIWEHVMPPVADLYRSINALVDAGRVNLASYYRHQERT